jgi:hypothetical protein
MSVKKFVGFLLPLKAVSPRNFTSLALVAIFFAIYVLSGGKIQSAPKVSPGGSFGGVRSSKPVAVTGDVAKPEKETVATKTRVKSPKVEPKKESADAEKDGAFQDFQNRINRIGREGH